MIRTRIIKAFAKAKEHLDKYFPVVGVLEELNKTFTVLEYQLPMFFKGISHFYYHNSKEEGIKYD